MIGALNIIRSEHRPKGYMESCKFRQIICGLSIHEWIFYWGYISNYSSMLGKNGTRWFVQYLNTGYWKRWGLVLLQASAGKSLITHWIEFSYCVVYALMYNVTSNSFKYSNSFTPTSGVRWCEAMFAYENWHHLVRPEHCPLQHFNPKILLYSASPPTRAGLRSTRAELR